MMIIIVRIIIDKSMAALAQKSQHNEKSAGHMKQRQDFDWFPLATYCCTVLL